MTSQAVDATLQIEQADTSLAPISLTNPMPALVMSQLVPKVYDYISLGYTGTDLTTVIYKTGGAGGTTVATLALAYSSGVLQSVARS